MNVYSDETKYLKVHEISVSTADAKLSKVFRFKIHVFTSFIKKSDNALDC